MHKRQTIWKCIALIIVLLFTGQLAAVKAAGNKSVGNTAVVKETAVDVCTFPNTFPGTNYTTYLPLITSPIGDAPAPAPMARELQYEVGKTYSYDYQITSSAAFGTVDKDNGISPQTPNTTLSYGTAKISITGFENGDVFVGQIVLDSPVLCTKNENGPDEFGYDEELLADVQTPLIFKQHKNGVIVDLQIANDVDLLSANYLKSILDSLQSTLTEDDDYPAVENGGQGSYIAHYTAALQQHGVQFTKTINQDSFIEFYSQGDAPGIKLENTIHSFLDRDSGVFSRVSFHETTTMLGQDPDEFDPETLVGVALWGQTESSGALRLTAVENTPANKTVAASMLTHYGADMSVAFDELVEPTHGINIEDIDLDAELDALEADPQNPDIFQRMTWIITANGDSDSDNAALNAIAARLAANTTNENIAIAYLDLLGHDGSAHAQDQLLPFIDPNNPDISRIPTRLQEQAIINLALVEKPQPSTYGTMNAIKADSTGTVSTQGMANQALGAMVPALRRCDPNAAEMIYAELEAQLAAATTDLEVYQQLLALGNTESPELLTLVQPYLVSSDSQVQWAAYWALRDVPGQEAEDLLLAAFEEPIGPGYPLPAAELALKNRPGKPSDNVDIALNNPWPAPPVGEIVPKEWDRPFGNDYVGGDLPGYFVWKSPPHVSRLEAEVSQSLEYYLNVPQFNNFSNKGVLASATAFTKPKDGNAAIQEFGYNYSILGKTFNVSYNVACANNGSDNIAKGFREIINYTFEYPIAGLINVGTTIDVTAHYSVDYNYTWDVCALNNMSAEVNLIPQADISASADAHIRIGQLKGGVVIAAKVIDVETVGTLHATYNFDDGFEACANIILEWEALNTKLYLSVDWWSLLKKEWVNLYKNTLWTSNALGGDVIIFKDQCWLSG